MKEPKKKLAVCGLFLWVGIAISTAQIVPPNWVSAESLEEAESPIQKQLDTGMAMVPTARDMATVKDARLLVIYVSLYEKLGTKEQGALYREQDLWLKNRRKQLIKLQNPDGGHEVGLDIAAKKMELTDVRIKELYARLAKLGPRPSPL